MILFIITFRHNVKISFKYFLLLYFYLFLEVILSAYIEQVCQLIIDISIKDVLPKSKKKNSLNIDEKASRELQVIIFLVLNMLYLKGKIFRKQIIF